MSIHTIADARDHLSDLIDRALEGEAVVITRDGQPVAEIRPVVAARPATQPRRWSAKEAIAWIEANRVRLKGDVDPVALVRQMRDEGP